MSLKKLRKGKKYSLHKLAKISGVNYQKIWQIENGVINPENVTLRVATKLAVALDCNPEDFMRD